MIPLIIRFLKIEVNWNIGDRHDVCVNYLTSPYQGIFGTDLTGNMQNYSIFTPHLREEKAGKFNK